MILKIPFIKMSGAGNDFVIIDEMRFQGILPSSPEFARAVCSRHLGIGADGLLVLGSADDADFKMEYYNADGSTGGMCGNGARCIAAYFLDSRRADTVVTFTALGDRYTAERIGRELTVHMKDPSGKLLGLTLDVDGKIIPCNYIDTGSPHAVVFVNEQFNPFDKEFNTANIVHLGRQLRYHETFKPFGTNVNFVSDYQPHEGRIKIRTYERGVEDETLSCGTGSIASAIITSDLYAIDPPIHVVTRSGATLIVDFQRKEKKISGVTLTGPISYHFTGTVYYNPDMHNAGIDVYYKDINNT